MAVWHLRTLSSFFYPLFAVFIVTILDLAITKIRDEKFYIPSASLVTGFLIGLVIAPTAKVWMILIAALFASLSKQFIGAGARRHIFNPAAFGIMAVSLIFGTSVSWWGVAWSSWPILVLLPVMFLILRKLNRLFIPVTFLLVYFIYLAAQTTPDDALKTLFDGSVFLFALVMLPEPITSPGWGYFKYVFGAMVAILAIVIPKFLLVSDNFLAALLLGNLIGFSVLYLSKTFSWAKTS